jgi:hypothetical protein
MPSTFELGAMSTQQLREQLAQSLTMTARHLSYLASIWGELERRGEDLSDLRVGLAAYLPQIAAGRLDAEAVIRFAGQATVLKSVAMLPLQEQRAIAQGKPVRVLTVNARGDYEDAELPAYTLTAAQARMVFGGDRLRTPREQQAMLESARLSKARRVVPGPQNRVRYDQSADVLRIGRSSATVGVVMAALMGTGGGEDQRDAVQPQEITSGVLTKLTEAEHRMLKVRASEAGVSVQDLMRSIIKTYLKV